ncbi:RNA polymerase sigma factor [Dysosmobacter sp. HCP28S3_G4]|uniref:RNA polymerase sigma factor n=1 Tax=Dysosmobacter sp. HCP28S3_G4 TaxID=3438938 RepID=UPI003F8B1526|nr:sigma-70 family RNA polymerase sigma factor [Dysosmobacter sp.]
MNDMDQVYRQHAQTVYKFLLSQCHDADLAEELTQETFYQAVKSIGRFDGSCKLSTWLCQIARHLWYQHLEKHRAERTMTRPLAETPPEDDPAVPSAEEETSARQGHLDLLRQIHDLPDPMREVVYLRAFGGLSFREIGDVLGKTENWARVTFFRGKERLRKDGAFDET